MFVRQNLKGLHWRGVAKGEKPVIAGCFRRSLSVKPVRDELIMKMTIKTFVKVTSRLFICVTKDVSTCYLYEHRLSIYVTKGVSTCYLYEHRQ